MFFVPFWWWLIWRGARGGQRFSLRHVLARTVLAFFIAEITIAGWLWAMHGDRWALVQAFHPALLCTAAVALLSTLEPLFHVLRKSFSERRIVTRSLKLTSIGFRVWCAFVCATILYIEAGHFPALAHLLISMEAGGRAYGILRFFVGATIGFVPIVWLAILGAEALDGFQFSGPSRTSGTPWTPPQQPQATYIPPPPQPPVRRVTQPPPRIVSMTVDGKPRDIRKP